MSKTKAGGWGDRAVDMHLRADLQLRLMRESRTFVGAIMAEIIKSQTDAFTHSRPVLNQPPSHLTLRNNHGELSAVVSNFPEFSSLLFSLKFLP